MFSFFRFNPNLIGWFLLFVCLVYLVVKNILFWFRVVSVFSGKKDEPASPIFFENYLSASLQGVLICSISG